MEHEDVLMEQEENCRKALKTLRTALFMRVFVLVLLVFVLFRGEMQLWILALMLFVTIITVAGALPLVNEWKKRRRKLNEILDQYE